MTISFFTILGRLLIALVLGALIGWEREYNGHHAGIRTVALISLGTCLFTIISAYGFLPFTSYPHVQIDPTRIASYIIAGIGFLGGGTIYLQKNTQQVKGLTSAASIWTVAAIGMACGAGFLLEAGVVTLLALGILIGLRFVEAKLPHRTSHHTRVLSLKLTHTDHLGGIMAQTYALLREAHIAVDTIAIPSHTKGQQVELQVMLQGSDEDKLQKVLLALKDLPEIDALSLQRKATQLPDL